jgi:hypothetical protein
MLIEIRCEKFQEKTISFHAGLNVVLGDDNASNSIGKSSLLMIIDFIFGGNSLLEHNRDIVDELGHHDYIATFAFGSDRFRFIRGTLHPTLVYIQNELGEPEEAIEVEKYTALLKTLYRIEAHKLSFRRLTGLFSRIWGKENLDVKRPLHAVPNQPAAECVDTLIRTFNVYESIEELAATLKEAEIKEQGLKKAFQSEVVRRIGTSKYRENNQRIGELETEIREIKDGLAMFALNISAIANREMLELKEQKDKLLDAKLAVDSKLRRVKRGIKENRFVRSRSFDALKNLFPEVNAERLANIETFHSSLAQVLKMELEESERDLGDQLNRILQELASIDQRLVEKLGVLESPSVIVDRVFDVSTRLQEAKQENAYHDRMKDLTAGRRNAEEALSEKRLSVLKGIEDKINFTLRKIVTAVFGTDRKSPVLSLGESNYDYEVYEDTGTGVAYSSLLVLDLAIFSLTELPVLVHDSVLFKNIENTAVSRLLEFYLKIEKQSFVALDEVDKYGDSASTMLRSKAAISLRDDHVLFIKDWRKK